MEQEITNYIEKVRLKCLSRNKDYRKRLKRIRILLVGESPPINGKYFYSYDENKKINTKSRKMSSQVFRTLGVRNIAYRDAYQFLEDREFYLMDLCDYPINFLPTEVRGNMIRDRLDSYFKPEFNQVKNLLTVDCVKILSLPARTLKTLAREGLLETIKEIIGQNAKVTNFSGLENELKNTVVRLGLR